MPSGRTHTAINVAVTTAAVLVAWQLGAPLTSPVMTGALTGLLIGTVFITPDLDMRHVRTDARRAWGALAWIWWPLLTVSKHRGVSHTWLRGPLLRAAYLAGMLGALLGLTRLAWEAAGGQWPPLTIPAAVTRPDTLWAAGAGYWAAQALHLIADRIPLRWSRL